MPQYGSSQNLISNNLSQTVDNQGNPIISADTGFGASPLGYAARAQALFGLPNSTFELTPPDTTAVISAGNPLPYWDIQDYSAAVMSGSAIYDSSTNSWGVKLDPGTAAANDYLTMTTRSYLINDDNLSLRQQALVVVSKGGTYAGTTQWNLQLTASYYDSTNTLLHSGTVATIYDNTTWTSMSGTTTTSGTAINAAAHYVDLTFTLTATAAVTSATSVTIKSCILQTSTGAGGAQSFLVTETFASSGTWTRPTGVEYLVAVAGYSGGNGGNGGTAQIVRAGWAPNRGGFGGAPGSYGLLRDLYVGDVATVTVGIGAGGAGGAGGTATKGSAVTTQPIIGTPSAGAAGGQTTFGSYLVCSTSGTNSNTTTTGTVTSGVPFPSTIVTSVAPTQGTATYLSTSYLETNGFTALPYQSVYATAGTNGSDGTATSATVGGLITTRGGLRTLGGSAGIAGLAISQGGFGSLVAISPTDAYAITGSAPPAGTATIYAGSAGKGGAGGGGGSGLFWIQTTAGSALVATGGNGGNASANSGSGGGGGGLAAWGNSATNAAGTTAYNNSSGTAIGGNGGNGGSGYLVVAYIA